MAELLVLALRVLPREIRKRLSAERNLPGKKKEGDGASDSARGIGDLDKHGGRRGSTRSFAACGKWCVARFWRGGEVSRETEEADPTKGRCDVY